MRFGQGFRFRVEENLARGTYDILAGRHLPDGRFEAVTSLTIETLPPGSSHPGVSAQLNASEAQALLEELWKAGLRPRDARDYGTTGHVKALEKHAETMEAIAIGLLRRDGVEV